MKVLDLLIPEIILMIVLVEKIWRKSDMFTDMRMKFEGFLWWQMFESDYAKTEYIEKDNVVFHVWKKEAHFDDYRKPVEASLEMLKAHENSIFIVDARNGFEDVKEDVEWGFESILSLV